MEVVRDDDDVEGRDGKIRSARLEIGHTRVNGKTALDGQGLQRGDGGGVSIDGVNGQATLGQPDGVAAAAAGDVQRPARTGQERRVPFEPGRGRIDVLCPYRWAAIESTAIALVLGSSVPVTRTRWPANFSGSFWSLRE